MTIPRHFAHLQFESATGVPPVRLRLEARLDEEGYIDEQVCYVLQVRGSFVRSAMDETRKFLLLPSLDREEER